MDPSESCGSRAISQHFRTGVEVYSDIARGSSGILSGLDAAEWGIHFYVVAVLLNVRVAGHTPGEEIRTEATLRIPSSTITPTTMRITFSAPLP